MLMSQFAKFCEEGNPLDLCDAFGTLTSDIVSFYCYGKTWGFVEDSDFRSDIRTAANDFSAFSHINRFFPFLNSLLRYVPLPIMSVLMPGKAVLFEFQRSVFEHYSAVIACKAITLTGEHNIINRLTSKDIPPYEQNPSRLQDEGFAVIVTGTETTMRALAFAAYHI